MVDDTKDGGVGGRTEGRAFGREEGGGKAVMRGGVQMVCGDCVWEPNPHLSVQEVSRQCLKLIKGEIVV